MMEFIGSANSALQALSNAATILLMLISLAAAIFAYRQIKSNVASQREVTANSIFVQYLQESLKFPELIRPDKGAFDFQEETFKGSHEKFAQYEFLVDIMLTSFELIFEMDARDDWKHEMRAHFREHRAYLQSDYFWQYQDALDPEFSGFLRSWVMQDDTSSTK